MTETLPVCPVGAIVHGVVVISKEDFDRAIRTAVQAERAEIVKMLEGESGWFRHLSKSERRHVWAARDLAASAVRWINARGASK